MPRAEPCTLVEACADLHRIAKTDLVFDPEREALCKEFLVQLLTPSKTFDCVRFLLQVNQVLREAKPEFWHHFDKYRAVRGCVLGRILHHDGDTTLTVDGTAIWRELNEEIRTAADDEWDSGAQAIQNVTALIEPYAYNLMDPGHAHFTPFWELIDRIAAYLKASFRNELAPHAELEPSAANFVNLWYLLVDRGLKSNRNHVTTDSSLPTQLQVELSKLADDTLLLIVKSQRPSTETFHRWQEALAEVLRLFPHEPTAHAREYLARIAAKLASVREPYATLGVEPTDFNMFKKQLQHGLHSRANRPSRVKPSTTLKGMAKLIHEYGAIERPIVIDDICCQRYGGRRISFGQVDRNEMFTVDKGLVGRKVDGCFDCRQVEGYVDELGDQVVFTDVELIGVHAADNPSNILLPTLRCAILRAWPDSTGVKTGMVVLASKEECDQIPQTWKAFVNSHTR